MSQPPQYPPQGVIPPQWPTSSNRALWWVLGIIIALLLILVAGGLFIASRIIRGVTVEGPNQVQIRTPAGNISVVKSGGNETGLPVFPGATQQKEGAQVEFQPSGQEGGVGLVAASYWSTDSLDKVSAWYHQNLDSSFKAEKNQAVLRVNGIDVGRADLAYVSQQNDRVQIVALEKRSAGTKISLVRIGNREAQ